MIKAVNEKAGRFRRNSAVARKSHLSTGRFNSLRLKSHMEQKEEIFNIDINP